MPLEDETRPTGGILAPWVHTWQLPGLIAPSRDRFSRLHGSGTGEAAKQLSALHETGVEVKLEDAILVFP